MRQRTFIGVVIACLAVVACGALPYRTARNEPACPDREGMTPQDHLNCQQNLLDGTLPEDRQVPRARGQFKPHDLNVPSAFIGLSISGGGSRAANFGTAVLEQLQQVGLLQHVNVISTTSGGGLPGSYYALKGPSIDWGDARERMGTNFLAKWLFRNVRPDKLLTTAFTHEDRSDLMADIFDEVLFNGATYGDLGAFAPGRPMFLANATNVSRGTRFTFTEENFSQQQRSYLHSFPLSQAVMASAAFPGAFSSVTLKRYPGMRPPLREGETARPAVPVGYDHLLDGGPADNLGIEALVSLAASHQLARAKSLSTGVAQAPCFVFVVDAYPAGVPARKAWKADPREPWDHLVDFNFVDAFDALLIHRRRDLLAMLGLDGRGSGGGAGLGYAGQRITFDGLPAVPIDAKAQLVEVDIPRDFHDGLRSSTPIRKALPCRLFECPPGVLPGQAPPPTPEYFRCTVWHINLSGLMGIASFVGEAGQAPHRIPNTDEGLQHPVLAQRGRLQYVTDQTDTNFKLKGPDGCPSKLLQDVLYASAFVAVREDHASRTAVCKWFSNAGLSPSESCLPFPGNRSLDLKLKLQSVAPRVAGRPGDTAIACVAE